MCATSGPGANWCRLRRSTATARTARASVPAAPWPGSRPQTPRVSAGTLQADGYTGFDGLHEAGCVVEVACWAQVRRKVFDLHAAGQAPLATEAVQRINTLHGIERDLAGHPPDERAHERQARAGPLLDALQVWLTATLARVPGRGDLAGAIRYALTRWAALTRYRGDGHLAMGNNAAERAISPKRAAFAAGPLTLGRKNWLFCGSNAGGTCAAGIMALLESTKMNGLDPEACLRHVLGCIANHPVSRVAELLPWVVTNLPMRLDQNTPRA